MKALCLSFVTILFSLRVSAEGSDWLILRSGDRIKGALISLEGGEVRFMPRWSDQVTVVPIGKVDALFFGQSVVASDSLRVTHRIRFVDGDRLSGSLLARRGGTLWFRLEEGTRLAVKAARIAVLETLPDEALILLEESMIPERWQHQGPSVHPVMQGGSWVFGVDQWVSIFRELPTLPDSFRLSYSIRSPDGSFFMNVGAFTPQPFHRGSGGMFLMHQGTHVQMQGFPETRASERAPVQDVQWREATGVPEGAWQEIDLYVDRKREQAWMVINGETLQSWRMSFDPERLDGRWLSFQMQHPQGSLQIADIEWVRWDGSFPGRRVERFEVSSPQPLSARRTQEAEIRFRNRPDMLTLRVREITTDRLIAEGEGFEGGVVLPRSMLEGLRFPWMPGGSDALPGLSIDLDTPVLLQSEHRGEAGE